MDNINQSIMANVTISIVSHKHGAMVVGLLYQIQEFCDRVNKVILTHNLPEQISINTDKLSYRLVVINNKNPLGFGANHNQAFLQCDTEYFCVLNPDIHLKNDPFCKLLDLELDSRIAIRAPLVLLPNGAMNGNARYFPKPFDLFKKYFGLYDGFYPSLDYDKVDYPDWLGGMFLLIKSKHYELLEGFDEIFELYYEDVDLSARAWSRGLGVALCKDIVVYHDERKTSHKQFSYFLKHIRSALIFFTKYCGRFPKKFSLS